MRASPWVITQKMHAALKGRNNTATQQHHQLDGRYCLELNTFMLRPFRATND
jgi:hypothetical protein